MPVRGLRPGRHFFPTVESAVGAFREETGAEWAAAAVSRLAGG
jgi:hypothetical protein